MTIKALVPAEYVQVKIKNYYGNDERSMAIMPYRDPSVLEVAANLAIRVPFTDVITADQGLSHCKKCNAVYAGTQPTCTRAVRQIKVAHWNAPWMVSETALKGQRIRFYSSTEVVNEVKYDSCDGELQREFERQQRFFGMLSNLQDLAPIGGMEEFKDCFLPGVKEHLDVAQLQKQVRELYGELSRHQQVIKMMIDKMNSAGAALSF